MEICDIYLYVCIYSFFYGMFTCASMKYLDTLLAGEALSNAMDSIAHTPRHEKETS